MIVSNFRSRPEWEWEKEQILLEELTHKIIGNSSSVVEVGFRRCEDRECGRTGLRSNLMYFLGRV